MHIPDGFLTPAVWGTMDAVAAPAVVYIARRAQRDFDHHQVPLMGVMGAFIFAAQMINFPVGVGTSGHLVGGALLSFTLGPAAAAIVMTAILATQALVFQDGGLLALGANVFNMAIAGVLAGYIPYTLLRGNRLGVFMGGFCSVLASAILALSELLASRQPMPSGILLVSIGLFFVSAAIEGAITVAVVQALSQIQKGFIRKPAALSGKRTFALAISSFALVTVGILFASTRPDGLQHLVKDLGIAGHTRTLIATPLSDYNLAITHSGWLNHALAGLAGLLVVYLLCMIAARLIAASRRGLVAPREG